MNYQQQLKDPRWQRRRLEIFDRDGWICKKCKDAGTTLTVHHKSYRLEGDKFIHLWDYGEEDLITLCEECHHSEEESLLELKKKIYFDLRALCEDAEAMAHVVSLVRKVNKLEGQRVTARALVSIEQDLKRRRE